MMLEVKKIKFYEFEKLEKNNLISQIIEIIDFENKDLPVRMKYVRGLVRYILMNNLEYNYDNNSRLDRDYFGYSMGEEEKLKFYTWKGENYEESSKKETSVLATYKDKKKILMDNHPYIFGFCEMQSKVQKNLKFKIVEKTKEKGTKKTQEVTGSTCGPAYDLEGHLNIFRKIDHIGIVEKTQSKTEKVGKKTDICAGIEILLRIWDHLYSENHFYNYENTLIWKNKY